jgi:hypothetical protein
VGDVVIVLLVLVVLVLAIVYVRSDRSPSTDRDLVWDALLEVASRLDRPERSGSLHVGAVRRWSWLRVVEGLAVKGASTDVFWPVRERAWIGFRWREIESVQDAASRVGAFLRQHPQAGQSTSEGA